MLDSLSVNHYDSALAVITFLDAGSYRLRPDDSAHLAPYNLPIKTLLLDGGSKHDFASVNEREYGSFFAGNIDVAKSESTFTYLGVDSAYADSTGGLIVVKIAVDTVLPGTDMRLVGVLTEDSVRSAKIGNSSIYYDRVARRFLPNYLGMDLPLIARGDTLFDTLRFVNNGWNRDHLGAALFVTDEGSHTILQAKEMFRFPTP